MQFTSHKHRQAPAVIIVSLIDVLLVVLIYLVVTTMAKQQPAIKLALPQSSQQKAGASDNSLVVTISKQGPLYLKRAPVNPGHLAKTAYGGRPGQSQSNPFHSGRYGGASGTSGQSHGRGKSHWNHNRQPLDCQRSDTVTDSDPPPPISANCHGRMAIFTIPKEMVALPHSGIGRHCHSIRMAGGRRSSQLPSPVAIGGKIISDQVTGRAPGRLLLPPR